MNWAARPGLVDCHAHLADPAFDADRVEVLERARRAGVTAVVTVGETLDEARTILRLAEEHEPILASAGLYPTHLDPAQASRLAEWIRENRAGLRAIGEVGLDFWKVQKPEQREVQVEIFRLFVGLARDLELPLNVHSRSAGAAAIELLLREGARRVQLHAFDGRAATASAAWEAGYYFSIPPSVVRSRQKQKLVRRMPLSRLLLESDSPVLGPDPAQRNEPANTRVALEAVAELKGLAVEAVAEAALANARSLYGDLPG